MNTYQVNSADAPVAQISTLATDVADIIKGYEAMVDRAEDDLKPIAQRLLALHQAHAAAMFEHLERFGGKPEDAGSMMGAVHQAAVTARNWFDDLDIGALDAVCRGEERLIENYSDTITATGDDVALRALLEDQRAALREQVKALQS